MRIPQKTLPNLLIPGYHKSGTTTLFTELSRHPDIFPSQVKEPFYFRPYINGQEMAPIQEYEANFSSASDETYLMEGSPTYIYGGERAALKIKETLGDVKSIICIRNPQDQLFSLYKHHLRFMKIDGDETFLTFIKNKTDFERQFYDQHLQAWFNVFGDNVRCVFFEELIQDPNKTITEIVEWLGLAPISVDTQALVNTNPGGMYRNRLVHQTALKLFKKFKKLIPQKAFIVLRNIYYRVNGKPNTQTITDAEIAYLKPLFEPHNQNLAALLSYRGYHDLPAWLSAKAK